MRFIREALPFTHDPLARSVRFKAIEPYREHIRGALKENKASTVWQRLKDEADLRLTFHLGGLAPPETQDYIHHQLRTAGCDQPLFTQQVIDKIHAHSKGLPRLINRLTRGCLLDAALHEGRLVKDSHLARVLSDLEA
ncbi:MAG: hypothetical protein AB1576_00675 [Bacillota bacterium]